MLESPRNELSRRFRGLSCEPTELVGAGFVLTDEPEELAVAGGDLLDRFEESAAILLAEEDLAGRAGTSGAWVPSRRIRVLEG